MGKFDTDVIDSVGALRDAPDLTTFHGAVGVVGEGPTRELLRVFFDAEAGNGDGGVGITSFVERGEAGRL